MIAKVAIKNGGPVGINCPACGSLVGRTSNYCQQCGLPLEPTALRTESRKVICSFALCSPIGHVGQAEGAKASFCCICGDPLTPG